MQLIDAQQSLLLVVDMQEKLLPFIHDSEKLTEQCVWLIRLANTLQVPLFISEQYPKGLQHTIAHLTELAPTAACLSKLEFSCAANPDMLQALHEFKRDHIIVCGIETHVCVLQTATELANLGKYVYIVTDATSSRYPDDKHWAFKRLRQHPNIELVTSEMVLFEWLRKAGTALFKEVSKNFLQKK